MAVLVAKYLAILLLCLGGCRLGDGAGNSTEFPCSVIDGENVYDLGGLAAKDYWDLTEMLHTGLDHKKVFYISVCHPLKNAPEKCAGGNTGVCSVAENANGGQDVVANAGQVSTVGPRIAQSGWIEYRYEGGESCEWNGRNRTHQTSVNILCANSPSEETAGPVLMSSSGCEFVFAWMTMAGCPKKLDVTAPKTCLTKFPNSTHTLNLHSLHSPTHYTVDWEGAFYEVNICGAVALGKCSEANTTVCRVETGEGDQATSLTTTDNIQLKWIGTILVLTYGGQDTTVEIQFHCDRKSTDTKIHFVRANSTQTSFTARTSVVCTPQQQHQCLLDHRGNVYDLRPLNKKSGNWEAYDTSTGGQNVLYHINVCGQVNNETYYHCPPGPIGACQTSTGKDGAYNLGFLTSEPAIDEDGSITLLYTNGDPCKEGKHSRSTRINFVCHEIEQEPIFIEKTETCEYMFKWLTPAACPRHKTVGSNCTVRDPLYGNLYDLNPLRNSQKDYALSFGKQKYLINLCGPLVSPCSDDAGICRTDGDMKYSVGRSTSEVTFHDGSLLMKFENGSRNCGSVNKTRSSNIIFFCDHEESGRDGPELFPGDDCTLNLVWKTEHACPPFHIVDCSLATKDGRVYDLNELSSPSTNQEYYSPDGKTKYVFNICRSVIHSKFSRCPYTAGACVMDREHENEALNIGQVHSGLYLEDDKLKIKYTNGDICNDTNTQYETVIEFICDKNGGTSFPHLIAQENSTYFFELKTALACPTMMQTNSSSIHSGENCRVNNTRTGYVFDLSPLKRAEGYEVRDDSNLHLILNVCDDVSKEKCPGEGSGACSYSDNDSAQVDRYSAGKSNSKLHILPGFLFLHYIGGDQCNSSTRRSTFISFICGAENVTEGPVLIHDDLDRCTYFVNWYTELACERRINCYVDSWTNRFDLSPLIRSTRNYEVANPHNPKEKFYMNVCRPLNPIIGLNCKPGSAACLSTSNPSVGPLNLGHPSVSLVYDYDNGVKMMYTHGSTCPNNTGYDITTMTHFICDKNAGKGNPVFLNITHDCQYQFEWRTALVCKHEQGPVCQIRHDDALANVNLMPLQKPEGYTVQFNNKEYKINVCGPACDTSGVCTADGESYGLSDKSELKWDYKSLKLTYYDGSPCYGSLSGHRTTSIYFECDMSAGYGRPVPDDLMNSLHCIAIFHWKTNVTCIEAIYDSGPTSTTAPLIPGPEDSTPAPPKPDTEDSTMKDGGEGDIAANTSKQPRSTASTIVSAIFVVCGLAFVVVLLLFKSSRGKRVLAATRRLFGGRGYTDISQTRTESSTLLGTTVSAKVFRVDESDDDLLRV